MFGVEWSFKVEGRVIGSFVRWGCEPGVLTVRISEKYVNKTKETITMIICITSHLVISLLFDN